MALLAVLPNSGRRKLLAANPLNKWEKKRLSRLAYSYETMAMKAARMGEVGDENYFYGKASGLTHVTKHYGPKKNPGKKKCVSIRLQSSPFVHTPGILRWAMAGYRIPKDRKRFHKIIQTGYHLPKDVTHDLLMGRIPYKVVGETVIFDAKVPKGWKPGGKAKKNPRAKRPLPVRLGGPEHPLGIRAFRTKSGKIPEGSSGWAHANTHVAGKVWQVSEATKAGRFWPAIYDKKKDMWIKVGTGSQWKEGKITKSFRNPLSTGGMKGLERGTFRTAPGAKRRKRKLTRIRSKRRRVAGNPYDYLIMGKYKNSPAEEIDHADTRQGADYLLGEYRMAYGSGWRLWVKRIPVRDNPKCSRNAPRTATIPFKHGKKYSVERVEKWVNQYGTPSMKKRWQKALAQYKRFHQGGTPTYITYNVHNLGSEPTVNDVDFGVSEGKEWAATYQVPKTSAKHMGDGSEGRYVHAHGGSKLEVNIKKPAKRKRLPERFHTPDGKFIGVVPARNTKITDWYRG